MKEKILRLFHGTEEDVVIGVTLAMEYLTPQEIRSIVPNVLSIKYSGKGFIVRILGQESLICHLNYMWIAELTGDPDSYSLLVDYLGELKNK